MKKSCLYLLLISHLASDPYAFSYPEKSQLTQPRDFSLHADVLALQAKQGGLDFAIRDYNGAEDGIINGDVLGFSNKRSDYPYQPGLRVGTVFFFGEDRWNCDFDWTFVKITDSKKVHPLEESVLIPLWLIPVDIPNSTNQSLQATWEANFNLLDLQMGKEFLVSPALAINPYFGGRIAFLDQHFAVDYGGLFGAVRGAVSLNDNNFAGFGLRTGLDSSWRLSPNFSLIGCLAGSIVWGNFEIAQQLTQGTTTGYNLAQTINQNTPSFELALGLNWNASFLRDRFRLDGRISYEFQQWWDMNQLRRFYSGSMYYPSDLVSRSDFTLSGLSLRFQVDL